MIGTIGGSGSRPPRHSGMQKPWSSVRWCDIDGSKSRSSAVSTMWFASLGCPLIFLYGQSFIQGSAGPSCSSPIPTQMLGRLLMKKLTQWSGAISMITSGLAAFMRRPSSVIERERLSWFAALTSFQPRMMSGAWLAAYTPTSLAMAGPRRGFRAGVAHLGEELPLRHPADDEVEAQQVGVDARCEEHDVVALDRLAHLGLQGVAIEYLLPVRAVLGAQRRRALKIEEKLAQPVVSHVSILPRPASGERISPAACGVWSRCRRVAFPLREDAGPRRARRPGS